MNNRSFKLAALEACDPWTMAEMGYKRAMKKYKSMIRRKRRVIEKRELLKGAEPC